LEQGVRGMKYEGDTVGGWGENLDLKSMETWLVERGHLHPENYKDIANIQEFPDFAHPEIKHLICEYFVEHNKGLLAVTRDGGNIFLKDEPQKNNYGSIQK